MTSTRQLCNGERALRRRWLTSACAALVSFGVGCDIVQGFESAGDTLFPEESTHLNAPGIRLLQGSYRELRFATGGELYLLARSGEDEVSSLFSMRYSDPRPCSISQVGRYTVGHEPTRRDALIAYFEDDSRRGTLRFADTSCTKHSLEVDDANLPIAESKEGFIVRGGSELLLVEPKAGVRTVLAENVDQVHRDAFAGRHLVRGEGRLRVLSPDWADLGQFGTEVRSYWRMRQSLVVEDATGIFRLATSSRDPQRIERTTIAEGACGLYVRSDAWATFMQSCDEGRLTVYNERTQTTARLNIAADSRFISMQPAQGSSGSDPSKDPFWFFYLRDVNFETGLGTLIVRSPDGAEIELGQRASLSSVGVIEDPGLTYGYAMRDIEGGTGTLVWWRSDGTVRELATRVLLDGRRLIVDFDGTSGNLAALSGDRVSIIARGVPRDGFEYEDEQDRWTAIFHDFDGARGKLSLLPGTIDALEAVPLNRPMPKAALESIAPEIPYYGAALLNRLLPGIIYFSEYDTTNYTGTLVYRNLELRFTAILNHGISDFIVGEDEIIYSIPHGDSKGVWVVQGK